ncbi:MAG: hypothetical protein ACXW2X_09060 [Thermoanaerobaculia bacterium]
MFVTIRFTAALGVALLIGGCGSSSGLISQSVEGGPGQPISVSILGAESNQLADRDGARQYILQVEVSNNSDVPETVTRISISDSGASAFQIQPASQTFNEMIDPGKEHQFDIRVYGKLVRTFRLNEPKVVLLRTVVNLANGDSYFYTFEGPVRDSAMTP